MKKTITLACLAVLTTSLCFAETVYLKNGKKISGKIVEQNEQQLRIDVSGVKITYFTDEIERIEGAAAPTENAPEQVPASTPEVSAPAMEESPVLPEPVQPVPDVLSTAPIPMPPTVNPGLPLPSASSAAEPLSEEKKEKILTLIDVSGTRESMESMFSQIISEAPPEEAAKLKEVFNLDEIIGKFLPVYNKYFTDVDLTELIVFYKSAVGKKLIQVTPLLMEDSMTVSLEYFKERMPQPPKELPPAGGSSGAETGQGAPTVP